MKEAKCLFCKLSTENQRVVLKKELIVALVEHGLLMIFLLYYHFRRGFLLEQVY